MSEILKTLTNIRSLRAAARELSLAQLESILDKLQTVVAEKREEATRLQQQEAERQERIEKYRALLKQDGITADELAEILNTDSTPPRKKRTPRPAKYRYTDENGETKTWTGQGRTPRTIQAALDAGKSLTDFEI
ncbi:H-NS family histone-like protein [Necropsobacter massiliensis]|uniref:H-NS family histone-like protein n=1 Tax=Necropsobacter massiliensis TaxID=1400001 RepID=UPI0005963BED|nr:H-NS family nucleoid-associated regulatory protein [Necropsobacter massiliensis]